MRLRRIFHIGIDRRTFPAQNPVRMLLVHPALLLFASEPDFIPLAPHLLTSTVAIDVADTTSSSTRTVN